MTEFLILKSLAHRPGHVKNRDQLMDAAYGEHIYVDDRTIDSHIKRLRKKFKAVDTRFRADRNPLWRRVSIPRPLSPPAAPASPSRSGRAERPSGPPSAGESSRASPVRAPDCGRRPAAGAGRDIAADPADPRGQRAGRWRCSPVGFLYLGKYRGEPDRPADRVAEDPGRDLRRRARRRRRARLGRRRRDPAARSGAPDDAPAGRADPHPRAAVRRQGRHHRRQPRAARPGRHRAGRRTAAAGQEGALSARRRSDLRLDRSTCCRATQLPGLSRERRHRAPRIIAEAHAGIARRERLGDAAATRKPAGW